MREDEFRKIFVFFLEDNNNNYDYVNVASLNRESQIKKISKFYEFFKDTEMYQELTKSKSNPIYLNACFMVQYVMSIINAPEDDVEITYKPNTVNEDLNPISIKKLTCNLCESNFINPPTFRLVQTTHIESNIQNYQEVHIPLDVKITDEKEHFVTALNKSLYTKNNKYYINHKVSTCSNCQYLFCDACRPYYAHVCSPNPPSLIKNDQTLSKEKRVYAAPKQVSIFSMIYKYAVELEKPHILKNLQRKLSSQDVPNEMFSSNSLLMYLKERINEFKEIVNRNINKCIPIFKELNSNIQEEEEYHIKENERIYLLQSSLVSSNNYAPSPRIQPILIQNLKNALRNIETEEKNKKINFNVNANSDITIMNEHCLQFSDETTSKFPFRKVIFKENLQENFIQETDPLSIAPYFRLLNAFIIHSIHTNGCIIENKQNKNQFVVEFLKDNNGNTVNKNDEIIVPCWGIEYTCVHCKKFIGRNTQSTRFYCKQCNQYSCQDCKINHKSQCEKLKINFFSKRLTNYSVVSEEGLSYVATPIKRIFKKSECMYESASGYFGTVNKLTSESYYIKNKQGAISVASSNKALSPDIYKYFDRWRDDTKKEFEQTKPWYETVNKRNTFKDCLQFVSELKQKHAKDIDQSIMKLKSSKDDVFDIKISDAKCAKCSHLINEDLKQFGEKIKEGQIINNFLKENDIGLLCSSCSTDNDEIAIDKVVHEGKIVHYPHILQFELSLDLYVTKKTSKGESHIEQKMPGPLVPSFIISFLTSESYTDKEKNDFLNNLKIYLCKNFILHYAKTLYDFNTVSSGTVTFNRKYEIFSFNNTSNEFPIHLYSISNKIGDSDYEIFLDDKTQFDNCVIDLYSPLLDLPYIWQVSRLLVDSESEEEKKLQKFIPIYIYSQQYDAWRNATSRINDKDLISNKQEWYVPCRPVPSTYNAYKDTCYDYSANHDDIKKYISWMLYMDELRARYPLTNDSFDNKSDKLLLLYMFYHQPSNMEVKEIGLLYGGDWKNVTGSKTTPWDKTYWKSTYNSLNKNDKKTFANNKLTPDMDKSSRLSAIKWNETNRFAVHFHIAMSKDGDKTKNSNKESNPINFDKSLLKNCNFD